MRVIVVLAVLGLASGPAWAQGGGDRELNRLKERLGLTDEQVEKIREIYKNQREGEDKLQKERDDKFKEVLTEEQKTKYEEYRRNPWGRGGGGGGQGGQGGGMQGWMERFQAPGIDLLKKDVGISDEQAEKIKPHLDHFNEVGQKNFEQMQQNGFQGLNWQEEMQKFQDRVKEMGEKVKEHLTDEQKEKYDKLSRNRFSVGGFGGFGGGGNQPRREERGPQRPSVDDRVRRVMETLKMENAEEAAVVRDLVKRVVEAQYALEDYEKNAKTSLDELSKKAEATEDEIKTKIDELRGGRKEKDKAVKDAQKALAELVTYRQELELIKAGILR